MGQQKKGFNFLLLIPILGGLGIALVLLCAAAFAGYAMFFYEAEAPASKPSPTATFEIVRFADASTPTVAPETTNQNTEQPATTTEKPAGGDQTTTTEQPATQEQPVTGEQPEAEKPAESKKPESTVGR